MRPDAAAGAPWRERLAWRLGRAWDDVAGGRVRLLSSNWDAEEDPLRHTLAEVFAETARRFPHRLAVVGARWQPTYRALAGAAGHTATRVRQAAPAPGGVAAVLMAHDAPLVAAVLGALQAGCPVVVLNASDPVARLRELVQDAGAGVLLTDEMNQALAATLGLGAERVLVVSPPPAEAPPPPCGPAPAAAAVAAGSAAFLVYTSGSTGRPKAVLQTHAGVIHNAWRLARGMRLRGRDRLALLGSLSGGQGIGTTFTALLNGATLCPYAVMDRGVHGLGAWLRERGITLLVSSASTFRHFVRTLPGGERFPRVRLVRLASEHATGEDHAAFLRHFRPQCRLMTTYSSSETGNLTQGFATGAAPMADTRLGVGMPNPGVFLEVLREDGTRAAEGEIGEVTVSSRYFAAGYWNNAALTERHFSPDPARPGHTRYRSGDRGAWSSASGLTLAGRVDDTVKIRGYRVDPGEVARAIRGLTVVEEVAVLPRPHAHSGTELLAVLVLKPGFRMEGAQLRQDLGAHLPSHLIPGAFHFVDALPLTPHGKIDRAALLAEAEQTRASGTGGPALNGGEARLAAIWSRALMVEPVGREDDFFELGGDSLTAAVIAAHVHAEFGVPLGVQDFVTRPTVAAMAAALEGGGGHGAPLPEPSPEGPNGPLSFAELRTWGFSLTPEGNAGYHMCATQLLSGPLDYPCFLRCLQELEERHAQLRTCYQNTAEGPVAVTAETSCLDCELITITPPTTEEEALGEIQESLSSSLFDLGKAPLVRWRVLRSSAERHFLIYRNHHIISDGWSWRVFFRELKQSYTRRKQGQPAQLSPLTLQYRDFARWQQAHLAKDRPLYKEQLAWWLEELSGNPEPLKFPARREVPLEGQPVTDGFLGWGPTAQVSRKLDQLARAQGATYYAVRLAAYAAALALLTGQRDFVIGSYANNRKTEAFQNLFGYFVNLMTLRFRFDSALTFRTWVGEASRVVNRALQRVDLPYASLCEEMYARGITPPEIRTIFSVNGRLPPLQIASLEMTLFHRKPLGMPWGCTMSLHRWEEERSCALVFDANVYAREGMRSLLDGYCTFLELATGAPDRPMEELAPALPAPGEPPPDRLG